MNGKSVETGFRMDSGHYQVKFYPNAPSEFNLLKTRQIPLVREGQLIPFACTACNRIWAITSDCKFIQENGLCKFCARALKDNTYNLIFRNPTLEEAIAHWHRGHILTPVEQYIIMEDYLKRCLDSK